MERTDTSAFDASATSTPTAARLLVEEPDRPVRTVLMVPGMTVRIGREDDLELPLADPRVSRVHAVLRYDGRAVTLQDMDSSNGTWLGERKLQAQAPIASGTQFRVGSTRVTVLLPPPPRRADETTDEDLDEVVAVDPASTALLTLVQRLGPSDLAVLFQGETGTGKELLARLLHRHRPRAPGPFVAVSCTAQPDAGGELTGLDAGDGSPGAFEAAEGGTLLLDEVGGLSPAGQARLLRALQERTGARPGAGRGADVRVVATTCRELAREVSAGRFREDLYFRLNGVTVEVPPLRSRPKDILALVEKVLEEFGGGVTLGPGVAAVLTAHRWPGNVRELRNAVAAARTLTEDGVIRVEHLPAAVRGEAPGEGARLPLRDRVDETERKAIVAALEGTGWNQSRAARVLGISRRALIYKMERYGLKPLPHGQRHA